MRIVDPPSAEVWKRAVRWVLAVALVALAAVAVRECMGAPGDLSSDTITLNAFSSLRERIEDELIPEFRRRPASLRGRPVGFVDAEREALVQAWVDFLASDDARARLGDRGFGPIEDGGSDPDRFRLADHGEPRELGRAVIDPAWRARVRLGRSAFVPPGQSRMIAPAMTPPTTASTTVPRNQVSAMW